MDSSKKILLDRIKHKMQLGNFKAAYKLLVPLLEEKNPEALFLFSTFSVHGTETEDEFEERSIKLLHEASDAGYAPATYALAACYDNGDIVEKDSVKAAALYQKASEAGYSKAKVCHGLNLYYGSYGINRNRQEALALIKQAILEKAEGAIEIYEQLKEQLE